MITLREGRAKKGVEKVATRSGVCKAMGKI